MAMRPVASADADQGGVDSPSRVALGKLDVLLHELIHESEGRLDGVGAGRVDRQVQQLAAVGEHGQHLVQHALAEVVQATVEAGATTIAGSSEARRATASMRRPETSLSGERPS